MPHSSCLSRLEFAQKLSLNHCSLKTLAIKEIVGPRTLAMRPAPSIHLTTETQEQRLQLNKPLALPSSEALAWHTGRGTPETPEPLAAETQLPNRELDADEQVMDNVQSNDWRVRTRGAPNLKKVRWLMINRTASHHIARESTKTKHQ